VFTKNRDRLQNGEVFVKFMTKLGHQIVVRQMLVQQRKITASLDLAANLADRLTPRASTYPRPTESWDQPFWMAPSGMSLLPFLELFFFSFLAHGLSPVSRCDLTDGRSWNLLAKRSVSKRKSRRN
jgi:hypothetical protein